MKLNNDTLLSCRGSCISDHKLFLVVLTFRMVCKIWYLIVAWDLWLFAFHGILTLVILLLFQDQSNLGTTQLHGMASKHIHQKHLSR